MGAAGSEARRRYGGKFKGHNCLQPTIAFALSARKAVDPSDTAYAPVDGAAVLADALIRGPIKQLLRCASGNVCGQSDHQSVAQHLFRTMFRTADSRLTATATAVTVQTRSRLQLQFNPQQAS